METINHNNIKYTAIPQAAVEGSIIFHQILEGMQQYGKRIKFSSPIGILHCQKEGNTIFVHEKTKDGEINNPLAIIL